MLGFIFLTALRDQRYKLIHYSKDELSIQLSNVTVHDEGVYKCFYYGTPFKSKNKTVKVLGKFLHLLCSGGAEQQSQLLNSRPAFLHAIVWHLAQHNSGLSSVPPDNAVHAAIHKTE